VWACRQIPVFRSTILPPSTGLKMEAYTSHVLRVGVMYVCTGNVESLPIFNTCSCRFTELLEHAVVVPAALACQQCSV
jgi:hypothetical protein